MVIRVVGVIAVSVGTAITLLFVNGVYLYNKFKAYLPDLSNRSFWGTVKGIYNVIPGKNKISFFVQLGVLILTTIGVLIYTLKQKAKPILSKATFIKTTNKTNSSTDLDTLHEMLLSKKEIDVGDIERVFKVSNEVAMEWCKILENADLALIDYPTFKKPILRLPEEKEKEGEIVEDAVKKAKENSEKLKLKKNSIHIKKIKPAPLKITKKPEKIQKKKAGKKKTEKKVPKKNIAKKTPRKTKKKTKKKS